MGTLIYQIKKHKAMMGFTLIIIIFLSIGIITINGLLALGGLTRTIYEHPLVVSNAALNAALDITKMHRSMKDFVLSNSPEQGDAALQAVAEGEKEVYHHLDLVRDNILGESGQELERQTRQLFIHWQPIREEIVRLFQAGSPKQAVLITQTKGAAHVKQLEAKTLALNSYARKKADHFIELVQTHQSQLERVTMILMSTGIFLAIVIGSCTSHLIRKAEKMLEHEKNAALDEIKVLRGILPICSYCKQIRDDKGIWKQMEEYIYAHSEAAFSHSICPDCMKKHYPEYCATFAAA